MKISWLMLLREVFAVYSQNRVEFVNTIFGQNAEIEQVVLNSNY
jgi:hypothetical protein